jgi:vacuolar-type H+-ATPase subunit E/Vma4
MIDALLATLEREAEAEISRVMDDARARAAEIVVAAEQRIALRREQTLEQRTTEARAEHERALASRRADARTRVLAARAALLDRLFVRLRLELPAVAASAAYRAGLGRQLEHLSSFAGDRSITVHCNPALAATLRNVMPTNGRLPIRPDPHIAAGFRLTTADGTLEIDATLETRLEQLRPRLALEALAALST